MKSIHVKNVTKGNLIKFEKDKQEEERSPGIIGEMEAFLEDGRGTVLQSARKVRDRFQSVHTSKLDNLQLENNTTKKQIKWRFPLQVS